MKALEYTTHISENGILPVPKEILRELSINKISKIKVLLLYEETLPEKNLSRFFGKWKDDKNAHDIVKEIFDDRENNIRSERTEL